MQCNKSSHAVDENTCWLSYHTWALLLWWLQCNKSPHADWHNRCSRTGKYLLTVLPHLVIAIVMVVNGEMANNLCSAIRVPMLTDTTDALGLENTCWLLTTPGHCYCDGCWGNGQQSVQCNKSPHAGHNRCSRTGKYLLTVLPHLVIAIVMVVNGEMANNLCSAIRVPMLTDTTDALGLENTCWLSYHTWTLLLWWLSTGKWPTICAVQ